MKLILTIKDTPAGRHLVLCDEQGEILPCQTKVSLNSQAGSPDKLVVEFVLDGRNLILVGEVPK